MKLVIILAVYASLLQEIYGAGKPHVKCEKIYKKVGCFKQRRAGEEMELLFSDRGGGKYVIDWHNFAASTHSIACRCAEEAKKQNFKYFSIRYWGECYAGRDLTSFDKTVKDPTARSRNCANPRFQVCDDTHEDECVGKSSADYLYLIDSEDSAEENVDGGFSEWSEWSPCSETCGTELMQERERTCTEPLPKGTGKACEGALTEVRSCKLPECPIDGGFSPWGEYGDCSATCGGGVMKQTRTCTNPEPQYNGAQCVGPQSQSKECGTTPCPVDGGYSDWSKFSECSTTCGDGVQSRSRKCNNPSPVYGGRTCDRLGYKEESQACKIKECPVDGRFGKWSAFSGCSATCGGGMRTRTRVCDSPAPQHGGKECFGSTSQSEECNTNSCPVDGGFSGWSNYGKCSVSCGGGTKVRSRSCTNPEPKHGGKNCDGAVSESAQCNMNKCPVDGKYGRWSDWSNCEKTCGSGSQSRTRKCDSPAPAHGGKNCVGAAAEAQACNTKHCPVDGGWTDYSAYGKCTKSCGGGIQIKMRYCTNPTPAYGGKICSGSNTYVRVCEADKCPVDGSYGSWSSFSSCTKSCGGGMQTRTRRCSNPAPAHGGKDCSRLGSNQEKRTCNQQACPPKWSCQKTLRVCQGQHLSLDCGRGGHIFVDYASYGRKSSQYCGWQFWYSKSCHAGSSYQQVRNRCHNRQSCRIPALNNVFGNPCFLTKKYLEVRYKCKGGPHARNGGKC